MPRSLSLILVAENAERILARQVHDWLDVLAETAPQFKIVLVNNGSSDHTAEIAAELAREYPQIRLFSLPQSLPAHQAGEIAAEQAWGEEKFVCLADHPVSGQELSDWLRHQGEELLVPSLRDFPPPLEKGLLERLSLWSQSLQTAALASEFSASEVSSGVPESRSDRPHLREKPGQPRSFLAHLQALSGGQS